MKLIYISAPYRADNRQGMVRNIAFANKIGRYCTKQGNTPIIPHPLAFGIWGYDTLKPEFNDRIMQYCLDLLSTCDTIWICGNWMSQGMQGEATYAVEHNIEFEKAIILNGEITIQNYHREDVY